MSRKTKSLLARLTKMVSREIARGSSEEEIIGALEVVKCNVAIAAAHTNVALTTKANKPNKNGNN